MPLQTGAALQAGRYRILRLLYGCSSGAIYLGVQTKSGEPVVIREITLADKSRTETDRFVKKARILTTLQHPNLLDTHQVFARKGMLYLVGGVKGLEPLSDLLQPQGLLAPEQAIQIVSAICDALAYLHSRALVHGDIRPENIFLGTGGQIKVGPPISAISEADTSAPQPAPAYKGTSEYAPRQGSKLFYLAPEALAGGPLTPATDIYAVGALLYEMLTGRSAGAVPAPPYALNPDIPRWLSRIVLRALSTAPERRYAASLLKRALTHPRLTDKLFSLRPKPRGLPGRRPKQPRFLPRRGLLFLVIGFLATVGLSGTLARSIAEARATMLRLWQPTLVVGLPARVATDTTTPPGAVPTTILPSSAGSTRVAQVEVTASALQPSPTATLSPTATESPTPSLTATSTPTLSPTATETLAPSLTPTLTDTPSPTVAATSTPSSTATSRPTNTPRPTATPTPNRYPAPILLSPANGAWGQTIFLQWSWPYKLAENEWFDIQVWQEGNQPRGIAWTKEPRHTIGEGFSTGLHYWRIVVIQARDSRWEKELTPPSETWTFYRAGAPPPSTPTVIP